MDRWKYFDITHSHQDIWNPLSDAKLDEIVGLLRVPPGGRVFDAGCGTGEFLLRMARRWNAGGVGVDLSPFCVARARERAAEAGLTGTIEFVETDGAKYEAAPDTFDLTACFGASWIWGGYAGTLRALGRRTKPGGTVVVGEPYWRQPPSPEYLEAMGIREADFATHEGNVATGKAEGLRFLHVVVSNDDDWDRYEGLHCYAAELYARDHPDDPDVPELLERTHRDYEAYLKWGREQLGWAVYLFLK